MRRRSDSFELALHRTRPSGFAAAFLAGSVAVAIAVSIGTTLGLSRLVMGIAAVAGLGITLVVALSRERPH